jgi:membrane protease YdiL (CAAX protease family)
MSDTIALLATLPRRSLCLMFVPVVMTTVVMIFVRSFSPSGAHLADQSRVTYSLSGWIAVAALALMLRGRDIPLRSLAVKMPTGNDWALGVLTFLAGFFGTYPLVEFGINRLLGTPIATSLQTPTFTPIGFCLQFFFALSAAGTEEIIFRGFGAGYLLARGFSPIVAGTITVVTFAAVHFPAFGIGGTIFILFWGTLPTALYMSRRSLAPGLIMHGLNNLSVFVILPLLT